MFKLLWTKLDQELLFVDKSFVTSIEMPSLCNSNSKHELYIIILCYIENY